MGRELNPKLKKYIDDKLAGHGAAQEIIDLYKGHSKPFTKQEALDVRQLLVYVAETMVGIREEPKNSNTGKMVSLIQDTLDDMTSTAAWCSKFTNTCIAYVEETLKIKSDVYASGSCWSTWSKTPKSMRVKRYPDVGALMLMQKGTDGTYQGTGGHVEIVVRYDHEKKEIHCIGGNTSNSADVEPNGDGVYRTLRKDTRHKFDGVKTNKLLILGFIKPF